MPFDSVWKPYSVPAVLDCPLAICNGSTVHQEDLIVCDNITKARIGEVVLPLYNAEAEWHYLSEQTPGEVTIIKIVDSDSTVKAPCELHSLLSVSLRFATQAHHEMSIVRLESAQDT